MQGVVSIVFNPVSGKGTSRRYAELLGAELSAKGFTPKLCESKLAYQESDYRDYLGEACAVIVCGGDGTVVGLLDGLSRFAKPFSMLPTGNQSLFARHFGMSLNIKAAVAAIERNAPKPHFYRTLNGKPFFHMASVGIDSEVVKLLSTHRTGPVGNIGYVLPLMKVLLSYRPQPMWIEGESGEVVSGVTGYAICGGTSQYALGLRFLPEARSTEARLCARFFPCRTRFGAVSVLLGVLCRRLGHGRFFAGSVLRIRGSEDASPPAVQADGEYMGELPIEIKTAEKPVWVLAP